MIHNMACRDHTILKALLLFDATSLFNQEFLMAAKNSNSDKSRSFAPALFSVLLASEDKKAQEMLITRFFDTVGPNKINAQGYS